ncbi:hypothetical protein [Bacillus pacificus]|uniref:hypothetical protein n=2 Tax=Bacillus cereus group TaxID=86661 RepID=UPI001F5527E0|nr:MULTISPECIES: hypothetical protein [Bacillus cereus group]MBH0345704.1 hypothetical protein [Bacillus thuringiensis]
MKKISKNQSLFNCNTGGTNTKSLVLWREILMAYIIPSVMAGIGALVVADNTLLLRACTTIGGFSAFVAWLIVMLLQRKNGSDRRGIRKQIFRIVLTGLLVGILITLMIYGLLVVFNLDNKFILLNYIWIDFPISAVITSANLAFRWQRTVTTNFSSYGGG